MLLHNENHLPEMCKILACLQEYVPSHSTDSRLDVADQAILVRNVNFLPILLEGDQLTAARARGSKFLRASHDSAKDRLDALVPVVEDWHARVTFDKVRVVVYYIIDNA